MAASMINLPAASIATRSTNDGWSRISRNVLRQFRVAQELRHAYQATGLDFFAEVARDIIRWMDDWLSDRERGGFYASQDADISMDDDGDYFTWVQEAKTVLTSDELQAAALRYDINETRRSTTIRQRMFSTFEQQWKKSLNA